MGVKQIFAKARRERRSLLTLLESAEVLKQYRIPFVETRLAKSVEEAVSFAEKLGYPAAMKILSKQIVHKTDVGGLAVDLKSREDVEKAFGAIVKSVKRKMPRAKVDGILVQKFVKGTEVIVGGKKDPTFDEVVMFGLGGVFVELFDDVSFRVVPINIKDAQEMMEETKGYRMLTGFRGKASDVKAVVDILLKVSKLLDENREIKELDINPIEVLSKGAVAVDARIVI